MVKFKKENDRSIVKTYGKKKAKERRDKRPIHLSVTNIFINNNIFISSSSSSDEFDKLLRQSSNNLPCNNNPSISRSSPNGRFFQPQERSTFYNSDSTSEPSSSIHLFKDTFKDSTSFSVSHIPTPPRYYKKNNKLVRVETATQSIKNVYRNRGRCCKVKRLNRSPLLKKNLSAASSTPARSHMVFGSLWGENVSPIFPPEMAVSPGRDHKLLGIEEPIDTPLRKKCDMSDLAAVLGRLEIATKQSCMKTTASGRWHEEEERRSERKNETEPKQITSEPVVSRINLGLECSPVKNTSSNSFNMIERGEAPKENQKTCMLEKNGHDDSKTDFVLEDKRDNTPMKNRQNDRSVTNQNGGNPMQEILCDRRSVTNESGSNPMNKILGDRLSNRHSYTNLRRSERVKSMKPKDILNEKENYSCLCGDENTHNKIKNVKKSSLEINERNYSTMEDNSWIGNDRHDDSEMQHRRLSLRPGKHWKRSLLQFRQEEKRISSVSSVVFNQKEKRNTIGPIILAKLIKSARRDSSLELSKAVNESLLDETLPILRVESTLHTITKRRRGRIHQPLDLLKEEEEVEQSLILNLLLKENAEKEQRRVSKDLFEEEEEFCHDDFLCSGVNNLTYQVQNHPSHHTTCHHDNVEESPIKNIKDCSVDNIEECLGESIEESPDESIEECSLENIEECLVENIEECVAEDIKECSVKSIEECPVENIRDCSEENNNEHSVEDIEECSVENIDESLIKDIKESPSESTEDCSEENIEDCSEESIEECPAENIEESLVKDIKESPSESTEDCSEENVEDCSEENVEDCSEENIEECPAENIEESLVKDIKESPSESTEDCSEENVEGCSEENIEEFPLKGIEDCPIEAVKLGALAHCNQDRPLPFSQVFSDIILNDCKKIGEGVYGEVFMLKRSEENISVVKIIPVEGSQLVNNEPQKCLDEVLSEIIISGELSSLRDRPGNSTSGFCELKQKFCLQGAYPERLVDLWKQFAEKEKSENDCPDMFQSDQMYVALELDHAGEQLESFKFNTVEEAFSVFLQTTFSLAIAEVSLEFEHRDLHIGNVLIKPTTEEYIAYTLDGSEFRLPSSGVKATIIDFTLSRMSYEDDVLFCDLEKDPALFTATGDYQFEVYRLMREDVMKNWRRHVPKTNVRWLHYLIDKLITKKKYKKKNKTSLLRLQSLRDKVAEFDSSLELTNYLLDETKNIVRIH